MNQLPSQIFIRIGANPSTRLDKALAEAAPPEAQLTRSRINRLIADGAVSRNGIPASSASGRTASGDIWTVNLDRTVRTAHRPENIPIDVIYEDEEIIVINKQAGLVVHPGAGIASGTLVNALVNHCGKEFERPGAPDRPGIVHRLDKDTTGLLVAAKTFRAHAFLSDQFALRLASRRYLAICWGTPGNDGYLGGFSGASFDRGGSIRIESRIGRHPTDRRRQAVVEAGGKTALTHVRLLETAAAGAASLVECRLETGRTHQIRVHLARIGHPLIGDAKYGGRSRQMPDIAGRSAQKAATSMTRQALHAMRLEFIHPTSRNAMKHVAPLPFDMANLLGKLTDQKEK